MDVNARFVAEGHIRLHRQLVATDKIWPLVSVHAHAMAQAMPEIFVVWAISRVHDDFARGSVNVLTRDARLRGLQRRILRAAIDVKNFLHLVSRLADYKRAADVR